MRVRLSLFVLALFSAALSAAAPARPHLILFLVDDMSWADCPIYGGRDARMPNLDRLASRGMTFTHAFVASPSCAPSRAALLTGLDPIRNGSMLNHARPRPEIKKWPAYFKELGYDTAAIGKTAHYAQVADYGFDHVSHYNYHQDDCIEAAVAWLAGRKPDRPLCLLVGTNWPHVPWPAQAGFDPATLTLPPHQIDTPETRQARARYLTAVSFADRDLGLILDAARKHLGENTLIAFTSDNGAQVPFAKWNCYDAGLHTPLVVAWPGQVAPGSRSNALVSWIDLLPTFLAAAGAPAPASIDGQSFLPVLRGDATAHRTHIFGTHSGDGTMNRYPIRSVRTRDCLYIRNLDPAAEHHTHIDKGKANDGRILWDSWTSLAQTDPAAAAIVRRYHTRPAEELYNLPQDPWELHNLALDPAQATVLAQLRTALNSWMAQTGDQGLATERALPSPATRRARRP